MVEPRVQIINKCLVCGSEGSALYNNLRDIVFGSRGEWHLSICTNPNCKFIWLNPRPVQEDIGFAYMNYYTHSELKPGVGILRTLYRKIQKSYLESAMGYSFGESSYLGRLIFLDPEMLEDTRGKVMYLKNTGGSILDVGCGSGQFLNFMKSFGWATTGVDFDEQAVVTARQKDLTVYLGALEEQNFSDNHFDVVTISHVIEHVYDPVSLLRECWRILKPGGKLIICTPNSLSLGHRYFKNCWRGLEPPRHLHIFTTESLKKLIELSGFKVHKKSSTIRGASYVYRTSSEIIKGKILNKRYFLREKLFAIIEYFLIQIGIDSGEEILILANKKEIF